MALPNIKSVQELPTVYEGSKEMNRYAAALDQRAIELYQEGKYKEAAKRTSEATHLLNDARVYRMIERELERRGDEGIVILPRAIIGHAYSHGIDSVVDDLQDMWASVERTDWKKLTKQYFDKHLQYVKDGDRDVAVLSFKKSDLRRR